jgi:3-oxoacyl-[acyl-carrier protein] reductase
MRGLDSKTVIVTGSGRGIGRAIALAFAHEGSDLVVNVSKNVDEMNQLVKEIEQLGGKAFGVVCDVSKRSDAEMLARKAIDRFGKIDVLVNNAGIARPAMCFRIGEEDWNTVIGVNLTGTLNCTRAVAPHMIKRKSGKIVNVSSIAGRDGMVGNINYAASKAGVFGITKTAAKELARYGINVNCVAPGFIETQMTEWLKEARFQERYLPLIPLGRLGKPDEVASLVLFLSSDEGSYITGEVFAIDGGMSMF